LTPKRLLATLPAYDLGWAGFNTALNGAHLDTALPNKLFEYIGCGLPVVTLRHKALAQFVQANGLGVVLDGMSGLEEQLDALDLAALRLQVAAVRFDFTVEQHIPRIHALYETLA
jgi:glycosyltransferase involved in cell wall biosynthesis